MIDVHEARKSWRDSAVAQIHFDRLFDFKSLRENTFSDVMYPQYTCKGWRYGRVHQFLEELTAVVKVIADVGVNGRWQNELD